jgi:Gnt-I system high-affinity gluconate transporter
MPGSPNSFLTALLPVILLIVTSLLSFLTGSGSGAQRVLAFISDPSMVMLLAVLAATYSLGIRCGRSMKEIMGIYAEAVKDIGMILLIIAGSGALKQVLTDSGVSNEIAVILQGWKIHPLVLGWLIASIIRVCLGSATIAGLTAAGMVAPMMGHIHANPNLMVLAIGAGSLMFSHVNDAGFWLFKEYFNLSVRETIRSWSIMETIVSLVGLGCVLLLNLIV